jgi:hypothetical protein
MTRHGGSDDHSLYPDRELELTVVRIPLLELHPHLDDMAGGTNSSPFSIRYSVPAPIPPPPMITIVLPLLYLDVSCRVRLHLHR